MVTLFPHQKAALEATATQNRVGYFLDMGLGKTYLGSEKLSALDAQFNLVICQKSKLQDWLEHFKQNYRWYKKGVSANEIFDLTKENEFGAFIASITFFGAQRKSMTIGIINYDLIFRRPELAKLKDFTLMLDESSLIQNEMSKRSKFILKKLKPKNVILLSGTPTGGKYERLWSQCHLLGWKISKTAFWDSYVKYHYDDRQGFPLKIVDGYKNVDRLKHKLREHGAVFMKSEEVFDLPEQVEQTIFVPTTREYRRFRKDCIVEYSGTEFVGDTTLAKMLYERMLCGYANKDKVSAFRDLVNSTEDRLIVFYNFANELETLKSILESEERPVSVVNGSERDLSAYDSADNSVTLIQYQAGAMGLNLQKSNKIVYFTPPLSSELYEQSKKRTHRIGQNRTCFYYALTCRNSIEEKIYKTLQMRRDYTEALFENER